MKRNPAFKSEPLRKASGVKCLPDFPLINQKADWTCGPAVVVAVAKHFNEHRQLTEKQAADHMQTSKKHGTSPVDMQWLLNHYCRATMTRGTSLRTIHRAIDRGHPVVVLWNDWAGHYAVIVGYDNRVLLLADPANKRTGLRVHRVRNFRKHWHARVAGVRYRQLAIVCRP